MNWFQSIIPLVFGSAAHEHSAQAQARVPSVSADPEVWMVFGMRVLLAISALLTLYIGPGGVQLAGNWTWLVFAAYVLHSLTLLVIACYRAGFWHGPRVYWIDICWYGLTTSSIGE